MRLLYVFNKPDLAIQLFMDEVNSLCHTQHHLGEDELFLELERDLSRRWFRSDSDEQINRGSTV